MSNITLASLKRGEKAIITGIDSRDNRIFQRLLDLGFVKGAEVSVQNISPLGDPTAYNIYNTQIALRKDEAERIQIKKVDTK